MKRVQLLLAGLVASLATASAVSAGEYAYLFTGSGENAGGLVTTDAAGHVIAGSGEFRIPGYAPFAASIVPGAGSDGSSNWDNQFPVTNGGLLFKDSGHVYEANLFAASGGPDGVGVWKNAALDVSTPPGSGHFPDGTYNMGTLTISAPTTYSFSFAGSGETAHGSFTTDAAGDVVAGSALFSIPGFGPFMANVIPGAGADGSSNWDNKFPIGNGGLLFEDAGHVFEANLFAASGGPDGVGVWKNAALDVSTPPASGHFPDGTYNMGTLVIGVPEPATWAMLILGLGALGVALRRREVALAA